MRDDFGFGRVGLEAIGGEGGVGMLSSSCLVDALSGDVGLRLFDKALAEGVAFARSVGKCASR